jgi:hypothetical protein
LVESVFVTNVLLEAQDAEVLPSSQFGVDAIIAPGGATLTFDFDVDAYISTIIDNDFDVDALLLGPNPLLFPIVDAFISTIIDNDFDVDATLLEVFIHEFDVDAVFLPAQRIGVDAQIVRVVHDFPLVGGLTDVKRHDIAPFDSPLSPPLDFGVDAILSTEHFAFAFSDVHYQDIAHFITPPGTTISVDAILTGAKFTQWFVDAILEPQPTLDVLVDAFILGVTDFEFDVDAILLGAPINVDSFVDAILIGTIPETFNVDVFIIFFPSELSIVDALLPFPPQNNDFDVDSYFSVINQHDFDVDLILNVQVPFDVDAIIDPFNEQVDVEQVQFEVPPAPEEQGFLVDAVLSLTSPNLFNVDAYILGPPINNDFLVDAVIAQTVNNDFLVDATVLEVFFQFPEVDAIIRDPIEFNDFDVDAELVFPFLNIPVFVDAILSPFITFDVDVYISIQRLIDSFVDAHLVINARIEHTSLIREDLNITSLIRVRERLP